MTIKAFFLNRLLIHKPNTLLFVSCWALGNMIFSNSCLANATSPKRSYLGVSAHKESGLVLQQNYLTTQNNSSQPSNILPPPPPLSPPNRIIKTKESLSAPNSIEPPRSLVQNSQEEYIFSAPNSTKTSYRIEVFGRSNVTLQQVRQVEPKAFIKGNIIQVGIFSQEENAMDLVKQLTLKGLWARVVVQ
ncbi:sporulation related protein [Xenococcus sp. PCC 7305]|uniref:SPOR domain-containing protein n=1 Tax=Xenococcus sp. PCC 7305 TaxID=102125 RepID=UPI0002ACDF4B|nr:SPOR domain-containing protein [Xenococcus sp. PCC 7305]ELS04164.1 sporulation related protein [Xenococcus sp. PCC 7305]